MHKNDELLSMKTLSEIRLNQSELKLLKNFKRNRILSKKQVYQFITKDKNTSALFNLQVYCFIAQTSDEEFTITHRGENWLEFYIQDNINKWLPLGISYLLSVIALIISILSLLK